MKFILSNIINRIKAETSTDTDSKLAFILGITPTRISQHKARDSIPFRQICEFCATNNISLDYIFFGKR